MSEPSPRKELVSWPEPLEADALGAAPESSPSDGDGWEATPWESVPARFASATRKREPGEALVLAEAALVAARNEVALLRARVERLTLTNEQLEVDLREHRARR